MHNRFSVQIVCTHVLKTDDGHSSAPRGGLCVRRASPAHPCETQHGKTKKTKTDINALFIY